MTETQAVLIEKNRRDACLLYGFWNIVCRHCGESCGGKLSACGRPNPEELRHVVCPACDLPWKADYNGNKHVRVEFMTGTETN